MKTQTRPSPAQSPAPSGRLLNLQQSAAYLGVSRSVAGSYVARGLITPVNLPSRFETGPLRRCLIDKEDLDRFIDRTKDEAAPCIR